MLTTLIVSWWLCAIFGVLLGVYNMAFWRPEPIYNKYAMFSFFLPAILTLNCVHISQFFITVERIMIMKSANPGYSQKILLALCILMNIGASLFLGIYFIVKFNTSETNVDDCMSIICMVGMDSYLVSYHIANGISVVTLLASLYFLILFRKTTSAVRTKGMQSSKMQNMIKYTICIDIWLDFLPQILTVGLTLLNSPFGPYVATLQRILFTFCGIFVNQRFYKVFVINENSVSVMSTSKVFQTSKNINSVIPIKH
uniref:7TM_GPCR_Srx domain-containing protein n=1 Tax=Panagrellus redivivus TaxID=6233 RepID=A0A7E4UM78_PANRE